MGSNPHEYVHPGADPDRDDLTDSDEIGIHRTDPLNPNSDGDPQTDGREVLADTDPNDRASFFHIGAFGADGAGVYSLIFPCSTARVYSVEWSNELLGRSPVAGMTDMSTPPPRKNVFLHPQPLQSNVIASQGSM